jgi:glycine oxidase
MSKHPDILIIGGGVIGLTTAYYLTERGASVAVVDKGDLGRESSWAGAGILTQSVVRDDLPPWEYLKALGSQMYPELSARLKELTKIDNGYLVSGGLEVIETEADLLSDEWRTPDVEYEELVTPQLQERFPTLAPNIQRAFFLPALAQVRNPRHLQALIAVCQLREVKLLPKCAVERFVREGSRIVAVETSEGQLSAERFLIAGGAWSGALLEQVGWRPDTRPIRGQIALLHCDRSPIHTMILCGDRYLVPRLDGRILVGSTVEDVGFDTRTTASAIADLVEFSENMIPALAAAPLERCWAGLRPGNADGLPYIGAVPGCDNLYVAAGHFRAGIQSAPPTGVLMADLLTGKTGSMKKEDLVKAFRLDRH